MVTMKVGDEDVVETGEFQLRAAQFQLASFGAIDEEKLVAHVNHLCTGQMTSGGQSTATTEYVDIEFVHMFRGIFAGGVVFLLQN